jgi:putative transposase
MARTARFILPGTPHHVVARGVNRSHLFRSGYDKLKYLKRFTTLADQCGVLVHGYCLMDNHVHWLLTPSQPDSLARLFHRLHTWWAMHFNRCQDRCGHLFENRYHSTPLEENHYWTALRYVEVNPRRAGVKGELGEWEYSSARAHLSGAEDPLVKLVWEAWRDRYGAAQWREFLAESDREVEMRLRRALSGNRVCGSEGWVRGLETAHGRRLGWRPRGRPPTAATPTVLSASVMAAQ